MAQINLNDISDIVRSHPLLKNQIRGASFGDAPQTISQGGGEVNANPTPPLVDENKKREEEEEMTNKIKQ